MSLIAPAPAAGPAVTGSTPAGGRAGRGSESTGVGSGARKQLQTLTCFYCGHGPRGHNDEHKAYWSVEVS